MANSFEEIVIGRSDYTREQLERGDVSWLSIGCGHEYYMNVIRDYERDGYTVKFETSIWRKIFCMGIYKVVAYRINGQA